MDNITTMSPDWELVDRLIFMRDHPVMQCNPRDMLDGQVALGEMTAAHADRLAKMVAHRDAVRQDAMGECDWCGVEVDMSHQCPFLADLPDCAEACCDC